MLTKEVSLTDSHYQITYKKKGDSVLVQINCSFLLEQKQAKTALIKITFSLNFLAGQGLAIQGRNSDNGNFNELLNFWVEDIAGLHSWLARKRSCTSHPIQSDILRIMCHMVLRKIIKEVNDQFINFWHCGKPTTYIP